MLAPRISCYATLHRDDTLQNMDARSGERVQHCSALFELPDRWSQVL